MGREPGNNLPVAACPAVVALGIVDVVAWVVVEHLHVVDEAAANVAALQQVVAENEVLREGPFQHVLEHPQVVDALAAESTLVEDVLIEFETGGGVDIQPPEARHELRVAAFVGHFHVHVHPRLHDAIALVHALAVAAQLRHVQRVRHGADEFLSGVEHQLCVGVECDDEAYGFAHALPPLADGLRTEAHRFLLLGGLAKQKVVEVQDGAAFALVSQPGPLTVAPRAPAVDKVENRRTVFLIQLLRLGQSRLHHLLVPRRIGLLAGRRVAHKGVVEVLISASRFLRTRVVLSPPHALHSPLAAVDIAQIVHLQHSHEFLHPLLAFEDGGHDDHCGVFVRNEAVLEFQLESAARMVQLRKQPVEEVYRHLADGHHQQHPHQNLYPWLPTRCEPRNGGGSPHRCQHHNPDVELRPAVPPLGGEELPAHMLLALCHRLHKVVFLQSPLAAGAHHHGAVVLLRLVLHLVVHPRLLALQHALRETHGVDKLRHRQLGDFLERVEDVHHQQILLRGALQVLGRYPLRGAVVERLPLLQLAAEARQLCNQHRLQQRQQRRHLRVGQVVFLLLLHLAQVAEQQCLVHSVVAAPQIALHQLPQHLHSSFLHPPFPPLHSPQLLPHHLLLLADHVVVVQHPFVRAAHQTLAPRLLDKQHIVPRHIPDALLENPVYTLHSSLLFGNENAKIRKKCDMYKKKLNAAPIRRPLPPLRLLSSPLPGGSTSSHPARPHSIPPSHPPSGEPPTPRRPP